MQNRATEHWQVLNQHRLEMVRAERDRRLEAAEAFYARHLEWREEAGLSIRQELQDENWRLHEAYVSAVRIVEKLERDLERMVVAL